MWTLWLWDTNSIIVCLSSSVTLAHWLNQLHTFVAGLSVCLTKAECLGSMFDSSHYLAPPVEENNTHCFWKDLTPKIIYSLTFPHVIPNLYYFPSSEKHRHMTQFHFHIWHVHDHCVYQFQTNCKFSVISTIYITFITEMQWTNKQTQLKFCNQNRAFDGRALSLAFTGWCMDVSNKGLKKLLHNGNSKKYTNTENTEICQLVF